MSQKLWWNAFRFGNTSLKERHQLKIFLMNSGVEIEEIEDGKYNVAEQTNLFIKNVGQILACGTCLKSRHKEGSNENKFSRLRSSRAIGNQL